MPSSDGSRSNTVQGGRLRSSPRKCGRNPGKEPPELRSGTAFRVEDRHRSACPGRAHEQETRSTRMFFRHWCSLVSAGNRCPFSARLAPTAFSVWLRLPLGDLPCGLRGPLYLEKILLSRGSGLALSPAHRVVSPFIAPSVSKPSVSHVSTNTAFNRLYLRQLNF